MNFIWSDAFAGEREAKRPSDYIDEEKYELYENNYYVDTQDTANIDIQPNPNYIRNQSANYDYSSDQDFYLNEPDTNYGNYDEEVDDNELYSNDIDSSTATGQLQIEERSNDQYTFDNSSINNNYSTSTQNSFESVIFKVSNSSRAEDEEEAEDLVGGFCLDENENDEDFCGEDGLVTQANSRAAQMFSANSRKQWLEGEDESV